MYDLPDMAALEALLLQPLDKKLKTALAEIRATTRQRGLQTITHVLVVEADDTEAGIVKAIGFSPLETRIDKVRGKLDFDWLKHHDGWWELLYIVGNDGFAYILLVEDAETSELARLCRSVGEAA